MTGERFCFSETAAKRRKSAEPASSAWGPLDDAVKNDFNLPFFLVHLLQAC